MRNIKSLLEMKREAASARRFLLRRVAGCLAVFMAVQSTECAIAQQATPPAQQSAPAQQQPQSPLPDSPQPAVPDRQSHDQNQTPTPAEDQNADRKPVGTAVAPYEKPSGIAGSRASGAAIAPAKQKRVHSFVIKFGLIAGAAAAGGAVIALSMGSRSRPQ